VLPWRMAVALGSNDACPMARPTSIAPPPVGPRSDPGSARRSGATASAKRTPQCALLCRHGRQAPRGTRLGAVARGLPGGPRRPRSSPRGTETPRTVIPARTQSPSRRGPHLAQRGGRGGETGAEHAATAALVRRSCPDGARLLPERRQCRRGSARASCGSQPGLARPTRGYGARPGSLSRSDRETRADAGCRRMRPAPPADEQARSRSSRRTRQADPICSGAVPRERP
jgi:hypothetical protein